MNLEELAQAVMVAQATGIDMQELERWAEQEKMMGKFLDFKTAFGKKKKPKAE